LVTPSENIDLNTFPEGVVRGYMYFDPVAHKKEHGNIENNFSDSEPI